jgi:hypothetical protein
MPLLQLCFGLTHTPNQHIDIAERSQLTEGVSEYKVTSRSAAWCGSCPWPCSHSYVLYLTWHACCVLQFMCVGHSVYEGYGTRSSDGDTSGSEASSSSSSEPSTLPYCEGLEVRPLLQGWAVRCIQRACMQRKQGKTQ